MRRNGDGKPIISMDIDGTLADYHAWFLQFATLYFGREFPSADTINPGLKLWRFMGISREAYNDCKLAYRQGGMKRSMPCLEGAGNLTAALRKAGCEVWICTTRPYLRLDNIDPDTQEWLRRNGIQYDALLYDPRGGDAKYREFKRQSVGRTVLGCAEDLPEQADAAIKTLGAPVWLRNRPYNRTAWEYMTTEDAWLPPEARPRRTNEPSQVQRWDTCMDLCELAYQALHNWRK
jgi:hypothetical protein